MKVSIIGTGRVGSATAFALVVRALADEIVLVGTDRDSIIGDAADLLHASAFVRPCEVRAGELEDTVESDVLILAASLPINDPDRRALTKVNAPLIAELARKASTLSPDAVMIVVSNPVDVMTYVALRASHLPAQRVFGTGTLIDTGRFRALLSKRSGIHTHDIRAYILGEHGDSQFPALAVASAGGARFDESEAVLLHLADEAKRGGYFVYQKKGFTNYAIAAATAMIVAAVRDNTREVLPVSTLVDGYQGVRDVCLSIPCVVGRAGVLRTLPVELNEPEANQFRASAAVVRELIDDAIAAVG
jgi:L-lactate dehydrogenase